MDSTRAGERIVEPPSLAKYFWRPVVRLTFSIIYAIDFEFNVGTGAYFTPFPVWCQSKAILESVKPSQTSIPKYGCTRDSLM
jgi:hypothetical protein